MTNMAEHAKPARRDHLWVLYLIAASVLAEVWTSWVGIGSVSGFPRIGGRLPTDWVLAVAMEGLWGYCLYAWLVASPGPRSRVMAMWSCAVVFALSLAGQILYHEMTAPPGTPPGRRFVIGFVTSLPVIVLAIIAVLIHLRHVDREEAAAAERVRVAAGRQAAIERAEADERTALQAALDRAEADREAVLAEARTAIDAVREELAEAIAKAEEDAARAADLTRKLDAIKKRSTGGTGPKRTAPKTGTGTARSTAPDDDLALEAKALEVLATDLTMSGAELARRLGVSEGYGRRLRRRLTQQDRPAEPVPDRPASRDGAAREDRAEDR